VPSLQQCLSVEPMVGVTEQNDKILGKLRTMDDAKSSSDNVVFSFDLRIF